MGSAMGYTCGVCGTRFTVMRGGGFRFDELHCEQCGRAKNVAHETMGETHLRFVKGLPGPYAVARAESDRRIQREYDGAPIGRDEYHALVEAALEACTCGGRFTYAAPSRCPRCGSTEEHWERLAGLSTVHYD